MLARFFGQNESEVDKHGHMGVAAVDFLHQELQLKKEKVILVIF